MSTGEIRSERVAEVESEFPTFNTSYAGKQNDFTYTACSVDNGANSFFNAISRVTRDGDSTVVTLPPGYYGSEPVFAARPEPKREDDGYLLEVVYDGFKHLSELQIYRADNISELVCSARLKHHLPHQFHGFFTNQSF